MAKKVATIVKLQIKAGQANPAPPVGTALGPHGINIMEFCKAYNEQTASQQGKIVPAEITIYEDRTFSFVIKTSPASVLLKEAAGVEAGSGEPNRNIVGSVSKEKVRQIAGQKMKDLNANDLEAAVKIIEGTARSMGIKVEG